MGPDRQIEQQELEAAVETGAEIIQSQEITVEEEKADVSRLEEELREAEMVAAQQEEAEAQGRELEGQINEVAGV